MAYSFAFALCQAAVDAFTFAPSGHGCSAIGSVYHYAGNFFTSARIAVSGSTSFSRLGLGAIVVVILIHRIKAAHFRQIAPSWVSETRCLGPASQCILVSTSGAKKFNQSRRSRGYRLSKGVFEVVVWICLVVQDLVND